MTQEEWDIMHQHPEKGYRIASSSINLSRVADLILKHHEHWDGRGYPISVAADPPDGGTVIGGGTYDHGEVVAVKATAAAGYHFAGWLEDGRVVSTDTNYSFTALSPIDLVARFALNEYIVSFVNHDGTELKTETVEHGSNATAPEAPIREGHTFSGWDTDFSSITSDLVIMAQYEINTYTVIFKPGKICY